MLQHGNHMEKESEKLLENESHSYRRLDVCIAWVVFAAILTATGNAMQPKK